MPGLPFANLAKQHRVSAPKLGRVTAEALETAMIKAIEKGLPDPILRKGKPRLNIALSVLAPHLFEKLTASCLDLSGPFRATAKARH